MSRAWLGGLCLAGLVGMASAATPSREEVDPAASSARFEVVMRLGGPVPGQFKRIEGELQSNAKGLWVVEVRVDARDLSLDGPGWMLRSTRSESFLDVENHPQIRFRSKAFAAGLLASGGRLAGHLELRGQRKPVTFTLAPATCKRPGHGCDIRVSGTVSRRAFGMTSQRLWVRDDVAFDFRVRLRQPVSP